MPEPIDLTETAPGQWSFVRLLRLKGPKRRKPAPEDIEAKRDAFFDSLAGEAVKPKPHHWLTGGAGFLVAGLAGVVYVTVLGRPDLWFVPAFAGALFPICMVLMGLCAGYTLPEAIRSMLRP